MFDRIQSLLTGKAPAPSSDHVNDLQVAVAALLVEAAHRDDAFDAKEQEAIKAVLADRFDLPGPEADRLFAAAQGAQSRSSQLYGFTRTVMNKMDEAERIEIIEMLWEVVYADGHLSHDEDALIRRVAGLIYVSDQDRGAARKRVLDRRVKGRS
jgi:uncharacterized tellurite resistance protein B-like protein